MAPSQREKIQAVALVKKKQSFNALLQLLKEPGEEDQYKGLHIIPKIIEQVQRTMAMCFHGYCDIVRRLSPIGS